MGANVLVVFYSRYGETEKLALVAGVGAIQMRGSVRLRRLTDLAARETIEADAAWNENIERMQKDYIAPRDIDVEWAEVLILAAPRDCTAEMEQYLNSAASSLKGKTAAVIGSFSDAAARSGLAVVPPGDAVDDAAGALAYGRLAVDAWSQSSSRRG